MKTAPVLFESKEKLRTFRLGFGVMGSVVMVTLAYV
tara:strand:- start:543 stop:650 length:108 start_codon:yes stop_codon:yes gene_type:complete